jgi:hypothetical protein
MVMGPQPQETYVRGNTIVKVSPPSIRKRVVIQDVPTEASAPSGLARRQGNEPLGQGKPMTKAVRQRKKKNAIPTQKALLPYNPVRNDPYFVG